jgi:predicted deacylase
MLDVLNFTSAVQGPTLTVLGAVHGNERCGTEAIRRVSKALDTGSLRLSRGTLVMVPITNPRAYEENVRFIDRNLNRCLHPDYKGDGSYEDLINPVLISLLENSDVLLDLHSYASPGGPFIFVSSDKNDEPEKNFATALGVFDFVYGWQDAFGNSNAELDPHHAIGTTEYAREKGAVAITLECGQHLNANAPDVGERSILLALQHLGMTVDAKVTVEEKPLRCVRMKQAFCKIREGDFVKALKHYDPVSAADVIARYADGEEITAPEDGFIVLPKANAEPGQEWFYFGVASTLLK